MVKPRPLPLNCSHPSSDVESAHRGAHFARSSSAGPLRGEVVRACQRICGVRCNLGVARDAAAQQKAAVDGAVIIAQEEAAHWEQGMAINASAAAANSAAVTAAAAQEAAAARDRCEAEVTAREAAAAQETRADQEAIAKKPAEVRALEEGLAQ